MSVYVSKIIIESNMALAVPESTLSAQSVGFLVCVIIEGKAKILPIKIEQINKSYVSILDSLSKG